MTEPPALSARAPVAPGRPAARDEAGREEALRETAKAFETAFVSQMLAHGGLGDAVGARSGFGGEAFSSLLVEQYATQLVDKGGFGLAEKIYDQLRERSQSDVDRSVS